MASEGGMGVESASVVTTDYFTEAEYRAVTGDTKSPYEAELEDIERAQEEVIERLEGWAHAAWRPRTYRQVVRIDQPQIALGRVPVRTITSLTLDGTTIASSDYQLSSSGVIRWGWGLPFIDRADRVFPTMGYATAVIVYSYGFDAPSWAVKRPCILAAQTLLAEDPARRGKLPKNTTRYSVSNTDLTLERVPGEPLPVPWPWDADASEAIQGYWGPKRPRRFVSVATTR